MWLPRGIGLFSLSGAIWTRQGAGVAEWLLWSALLGGVLLLWGLYWWRSRAWSVVLLTLLAGYALVGMLIWSLGGAAWAYWLLLIPLGGALWYAGATGAFLSAPVGAGTVVATSFALTGNPIPTDTVALSWAVGLVIVSLTLGWAWKHRTLAAQHAVLEQAAQALEHSEAAQRELRDHYRELASHYRRLEGHLIALQDAVELLHALRDAHTLETVYHAILHRLHVRVGVAGAALLLPNQSGMALHAVSAVGVLAPLQHTTLTMPPHPSCSQDSLAQPIQEMLAQALRSERLAHTQSIPLEHSHTLVYPLQQSGRLIGVLLLVAHADQGFDNFQRTRLRLLVPHLVGIVSLLEQLRLVENRLAETQLLYDLESLPFSVETVPALCQRALMLIKSVLPFEQAQVLLKQGDALQVVAQLGAMPALGALFAESLPKQAQIVLHDKVDAAAVAPARALMLAPLRGGGRTEGVIVLGRTEQPPFNELELDLLQTLALQITSVLDRAQLLSDLERLASTDGLTGLYNYRHFQVRYHEEINRCRRYQHPMAIMLIDLDGFKQVNDHYGHLEGDCLLVQLAEVLQRSLRNAELIARYGGDEFVVLMPSTNLQGALAAAKRVLETVRETPFVDTLGQPRLRISVSIGVAAYPDSTENPAEVLEKADEALELAKRNGRNQVAALENSA